MIDQAFTKDARALSAGVMTYLRRNSRVSTAVPKIQKLLTRVTAQARKEKTAIVTTSVGLTVAEKELLQRTLEKHLHHGVVVENEVTPNVVGGMKIQVGDWVIDTTIAGQLTQLVMQLAA